MLSNWAILKCVPVCAITHKLGNADFKTKLAAYKKAAAPVDDVLAATTIWTDTEIDQRTANLAKLGYEKYLSVIAAANSTLKPSRGPASIRR